MTSDPHGGNLGKVYGAQVPDEVAAVYDAWATSYDAEMAAAGYRHPSIGTALLARHLPRGSGPFLDAGCGTGLLGDWLGILGLGPVEGAVKVSASSPKDRSERIGSRRRR